MSVFEALNGADNATRAAAVREKLIEKLTEDWHDGFSFALGRTGGEPILD